MTKWAVVSAFQIEPHWSSGWHGLSVTFKAIFHMTVFSSHLSYRLVLNVQHVGFRMIYWKKLNMIFIMMFSLVYNHLKLRIIIFWMNVLFFNYIFYKYWNNKWMSLTGLPYKQLIKSKQECACVFSTEKNSWLKLHVQLNLKIKLQCHPFILEDRVYL